MYRLANPHFPQHFYYDLLRPMLAALCLDFPWAVWIHTARREILRKPRVRGTSTGFTAFRYKIL
jgi:hypothetical protein